MRILDAYAKQAKKKFLQMKRQTIIPPTKRKLNQQ